MGSFCQFASCYPLRFLSKPPNLIEPFLDGWFPRGEINVLIANPKAISTLSANIFRGAIYSFQKAGLRFQANFTRIDLISGERQVSPIDWHISESHQVKITQISVPRLDIDIWTRHKVGVY